jgi:nitrogen regulatory protein PII 1
LGFSLGPGLDKGNPEGQDGLSPNNFRRGQDMIMIRSVVRPEKVDAVLAALMEAGFPAVTKMSVVGRGKQRGIKIGEITYDEIPKELLLMVVKDQDRDFVIKTVLRAARTGDKGTYGDGKIFVSPVEEVYTISSGIKEGATGEMEEVKP